MNNADHHRTEDQKSSDTLNTKWRWVFSAIIVFQLAAVILPPLSYQARGQLGVSPIVDTALKPVEKYGQFTYLDRGYAFFAPDPGPSHLVQAAITAKDGNKVERMYPDLDDQWPRLLYHRHFMLAEYLEEIYQPPGPPRELAEVDREAAEYWVRSRARYEHVRLSFIDHLRKQNPGQDVAIRRIEHLIPDLTMYVENPIALDAPELYRVLLDRSLEAENEQAGTLVAPDRPAETIPPPQGNKSSQDDEPEDAIEDAVKPAPSTETPTVNEPAT